jgi:hypothetical protein
MRNGTFAQFNGRGTKLNINFNGFVLFMRDDVVPPADGGAGEKAKAHSTDDPVGDETRCHKGDSKGKHHGPKAARRHGNVRFLGVFAGFSGIKFY